MFYTIFAKTSNLSFQALLYMHEIKKGDKMINSIQSFQNVPRLGTRKQTNANDSPNFGAKFSYEIATQPERFKSMQIRGKKIIEALQDFAKKIEDLIQRNTPSDTEAKLEFSTMSDYGLLGDKPKKKIGTFLILSREGDGVLKHCEIEMQIGKNHHTVDNKDLKRLEGIIKRYAKKQAAETQKKSRRQALAESFQQCSGLIQRIREKGLNT